ncbi:hypothetical protein STEG23_006805, partial [Scotinomys teguina]
MVKESDDQKHMHQVYIDPVPGHNRYSLKTVLEERLVEVSFLDIDIPYSTHLTPKEITSTYETSGCVRIIGGDTVVPHSRPYMVLLKLGKYICAGTLIDKNWVLTAAHCKVVKHSQAVLGAHSRDKNEPEKQIISIKNAFPYPCFDQNTHEGDLQLLQLNEKAAINKNVAILALPKKGVDVKPGTKCRVAGWGIIHNNSTLSPTLREVNITVIDRKICNDEKHYNFNPVIGLNMICAGNLQGGKDSCK